MYKCFKISGESFDLTMLSQEENFVKNCKMYGEKLKEEIAYSFDKILEKALDANGVISGEYFIDTWFSTEKYDVFLSYSHDDQEIALLLAGFLRHQFGLKVFIDELFWGSADKLLQSLDERYCKKAYKKYDYKKRNFTTTHVHAMLSTAIAKTIDNSEIIIFLNTEKSTYKLKDEICKERTLSPWIYEEIFFTSVIKTKEWYEHREEYAVKESFYLKESMSISYVLPDEHLIPLRYEDICAWKDQWKKEKQKENGIYKNYFFKEKGMIRHPLNVLYNLKREINNNRE